MVRYAVRGLVTLGFASAPAFLGNHVVAGPPVRCTSGPCVELVAEAVNDQAVPPTASIHVRPGDVIQAAMFISGWGGAFLPGGYEAQWLIHEGAISGSSGTVLPVGWDAPVFPHDCANSTNCPAQYPICNPQYRCVGPSFDPDLGVFIDTAREDFAFFGRSAFTVFDNSNLNYRVAGILEAPPGVPDPGRPAYAATLILAASDDACGLFVFRVDDENTFFFDASSPPLLLFPPTRPLSIHVCEDDRVFCNGLESCDAVNGCQITPPPNCDDGDDCTADSCNIQTDSCAHVASCGACCDALNGDCTDDVLEADCQGTQRIWTAGTTCAVAGCDERRGACCDADAFGSCSQTTLAGCQCDRCTWYKLQTCDEIECPHESIPTVSHWGLVVLTLSLLIGAKAGFPGRASL